MESNDEDRQPLPEDWQRSEHATRPAKRPHGIVQRDNEHVLRNYVRSLFCNICVYQCTLYTRNVNAQKQFNINRAYSS